MLTDCRNSFVMRSVRPSVALSGIYAMIHQGHHRLGATADALVFVVVLLFSLDSN